MFINDLLNCLENVDTKFSEHNVKSTNPALADDIACISLSPMGLQKMLHIRIQVYGALRLMLKSLMLLCLVKANPYTANLEIRQKKNPFRFVITISI